MKVTLTQGLFAEIDDRDADLITPYKWHILRTRKKVYATGRIQGKRGPKVLLHRLLMGAKKGELVDHLDGDGLNCRRSNLRLATNAQNIQRAGFKHASKTGFRGVYRNSAGSWGAQIRCRSDKQFLGCYPTPEEAARAYDAAAKTLYGDKAYLNFPEEG